MNILVLHGPNLNLLGSISAQLGKRITLDKINTGLRRHVRNSDVTIKITQTHKVFQALNFIQRNRNWAQGILFAPMAWANYEYSIRDALKIAAIPTVQLLFSRRIPWCQKGQFNIFRRMYIHNYCTPEQIYIDGINALRENI